MKKNLSDLLKYLNQSHKIRTSAEIANALQISTRSVKNYVDELNALYNKKIIISSRNGYEINKLFSMSFIIDNDEEIIPQTTEERSFYIIKQFILKHNSHINLFDLCDDLCVSYSTIKSLIAKMNKTYQSYNIKFICKNDCLQIIGNEKDIRRLINYIIHEESKSAFIDTTRLKESFTNIDIDGLIQIVTETFENHHYYLNDFSATNLILHLVIIIERGIGGNQLDSGESNFTIENNQENMLFIDLCNQLENKFKIHLNQFEQFEIYMLFKVSANFSLSTNEELRKIVSDEIISLTEYYIKEINSLYMIDLSKDNFTIPFSLHLKNLIFRAKENRYITNPLTDVIKMNSPIVFDIAIFMALDISERYNISINEDEIAFLAMHVGAEIERQNINKSKITAILLCPHYHNISVDILNKLLLNFSHQINIAYTVRNENELYKIESQMDFPEEKLLLTTVPLNDEHLFTIVNILPFNLESQYDMIQNAILFHKDRYKNYKLKTYFHTFFEKDLFICESKMKNKDEVLTFLCDLLYKKRYVNSKFKEKIYRREKVATTAFGHIAIPHSMDMDAIKTCVTVVISKKGIQWDSNIVHLVLLLAINKTDKTTFRELYESFIDLFSEEIIMQEVKNCHSFEEFEALIYNYVHTNSHL